MIRKTRRPRTASEALSALRLGGQGIPDFGPGDCRVWASVCLDRDGRIHLAPLRLVSAGRPPGYSACVRRLPRLLRSLGFPAGLFVREDEELRAGTFRRL